MAVKKGMKQIGPGHYRGHEPKNQTPEQKKAQAEQDKKSLAFGKETAATLQRNIRSGTTVF